MLRRLKFQLADTGVNCWPVGESPWEAFYPFCGFKASAYEINKNHSIDLMGFSTCPEMPMAS